MELTEPENWYKFGAATPEDCAALMQQILEDYWDSTTSCGEIPEQGCKQYALDSPFIEWLPADPFIAPDIVPQGYLKPPFTVVTQDIISQFLGYQVGDVLTDITRFPIGSLPTVVPPGGFARLRLYIAGTGTVAIHFLNVPLGGAAIVTRDSNLSTTVTLELNLDTISIPAESEQIIIHEATFDTPGEHTLDITFFPLVNDEIPFIYYGGGIRKIELCGFDDWGQIPMQFRVQNCELQWRMTTSQDWQALTDLSQCAPPSVPTGAMMPFGASTIPSGWLLCDGSAVSRATYAALFAVIGTTFGVGNGSSTFNLPGLPGRTPIGAGQGQDLTNRALAAVGGEETHVLTVNEMPAHNHQNSNQGVIDGTTHNAIQSGNAYGTTYPQSNGGGLAHNNMQPWLAVNYIIKV